MQTPSTQGPPLNSHAAPPPAESAFPVPITATQLYGAASVEKRFLALLLDSIYALWPVAAAFGVFFSLGPDALGKAPEEGLSQGMLTLFVLSMLWPLWYNFTRDGNDRGAGFGKRVMKLMVVDVNTNRPATLEQSVKRQAVQMLLGFIPIVGWAIEPLMVLLRNDGRRLGDLAAKTMVIEAREYVE